MDMPKAITKNEDFKYKAEAGNPAVLGVLEGPVADIQNPTRNGRKYSEELWNRVFNDPIVNEMLENGGIFGEAQHPADRTEVDTEKIAIAMKEKPVKRDGKLWAKFYILDTPCGRVLKTLADFGYKIGISSRGQGDLITDYSGNESVDPSTYEFTCFDAVLLPAVKAARMNVVEGLEKKKVSLKESLDKLLNESSEKDRKIMEDTIKSLNEELDHYSGEAGELRGSLFALLDEFIQNHPEVTEKDCVREFRTACSNIFGEEAEEEVTEECNNESCTDKEAEEEKSVDNSEDILVEQLQQALKQKQELEKMVIGLQEKLSVSYAKELVLKDEIDKSKSSIAKLSSDSKKVIALQEKLTSLVDENAELNKKLSDSTANVSQLNESIKAASDMKATLTEKLNEQLSAKDAEIKALRESFDSAKEEFAEKQESLTESIAELQKDLKIKTSEYSGKLEKSNQLVEKYRRIANKAVDKYIDSQALKLGVTSNEIKNKLAESYTFDDIDRVCEELRGYQLTISKLPFQSNLTENMRIKATTKQTSVPANPDDVVDDNLLRLAGMK